MMNSHEIRTLPDYSALPHNLVIITVWKPDMPNSWSGVRYTNDEQGWHNTRNYYDRLEPDGQYDWTFDGFRLSAFGLRYLNNKAPEEVQQAMDLLSNWAQTQGLTLGN